MSRFLLAASFLLLLQPADAQHLVTLAEVLNSKEDCGIIAKEQAKYLNSFYTGKVDIADELINGREYVPYYFKCRLKPLLYDEIKRTGTLIFNGRKYSGLKLEYDTFLDQLIYSDSTKLIDDKIFKLAMNKDPVDEFALYLPNDSLKFRHFRGGKDSKFNLPDGFYEVIYDGKSKLIIKHQSFLVEKDGMYEYRYTPAEYLMTGASFIRVKSSSGFLRMFGNESGTVKKYMRTNKIHFRLADKDQIAAVIKYYDKLAAGK
jgi:hypothetical protein